MYFTVSHATLSLLTASLLATSGDITQTWTSPMYPKLHSNDTSVNPVGRNITQEEDEWIGSLLNIGAIVGPLPFSFVAEYFGRKIGLLAIAVPHIISYLSMAFGTNVYVFYFARLLGGVAVGGGYTLLPMYIAEVSEESKRGVFSVLLGFFWSFGNLLPNALGPFMSVMWFNVAMAAFPIAFFLIFSIIGCESPYYLVGANKMQEAEELLLKIRPKNNKALEMELKEIKSNVENETGGKLSDILTNAGLRKALVVSALLISFQQLSGINAIQYYLLPLFQAANTSLNSELASFIVSFLALVFSSLAPLVAKRFRRKTILILTYGMSAVTLGVLGGFFYIKNKTDIPTENINFLVLLCLVLYYFSFQIGPSTMPWTISAELFPKNVKQISASITSSACWVASFFVTKYFVELNNLVDISGSFFIFAGFCLMSILFTVLCVPETFGKTFAEIQDMIQK